MLASLDALSHKYRKRIIMSTHPRTRKRLATLAKRKIPAKVEFLKPLGFFDYVRLQQEAGCVLSDSGTLTEESSILGFPAVMLRQAHERPEGMDVGTLIMSGLAPERVLAAVKATMTAYADKAQPFAVAADYRDNNVAAKVVRIIMSYTDFVNRTVWFK